MMINFIIGFVAVVIITVICALIGRATYWFSDKAYIPGFWQLALHGLLVFVMAFLCSVAAWGCVVVMWLLGGAILTLF